MILSLVRLECAEQSGESWKPLLWHVLSLATTWGKIKWEAKKLIFWEDTVLHGRYVGLKSTEKLRESCEAFVLEKIIPPFFLEISTTLFPLSLLEPWYCPSHVWNVQKNEENLLKPLLWHVSSSLATTGGKDKNQIFFGGNFYYPFWATRKHPRKISKTL